MRTVVYQSYRTTGVPSWLARCLGSVQAWASRRGFAYRFLGDELFDRVPTKVASKLVMADLARLVVAEELLADYDRAVWVDADVVVIDPGWQLPTERDFYLCHELWPIETPGGLAFDVRVNNAVSIYARGNPFLAVYLDACRRQLARAGEPDSLALGTALLTRLHQVTPLPLLYDVGMFGPAILADLAHGTDRLRSAYLSALPGPVAAANCCASMRGQLTDAIYAAAIERCLAGELYGSRSR